MACCGDAPTLDSAVLCTLFNSFAVVAAAAVPCLSGPVEVIARHGGVCKRLTLPCGFGRFRLV